MGIKERILQVIDYKRVSVSVFERTIGVANGYLRNTRNVSAENCAKILTAYPEISPEWLLLGEGDMLKPSTQNANNITGHNVCGVNVNGRDIDIKCPTEYETLLNIVNTHNEVVARMQSQIDKAQEQINELLAILKSKL